MTTVYMQPGEHDVVTDLVAVLVQLASFGLVELNQDRAARPYDRSRGGGLRQRQTQDHERE